MGRRDKEAPRHSNAWSAQIRRLGEGTLLCRSVSNCATSWTKQGQRDKEQQSQHLPHVKCNTQTWRWLWCISSRNSAQAQRYGGPAFHRQTGAGTETVSTQGNHACDLRLRMPWRAPQTPNLKMAFIWSIESYLKTQAPVGHPGLISSLFYISYSMHY